MGKQEKPHERLKSKKAAARRRVVRVAAALILRGGRVLLMQRHNREPRFPLRWEFPGGKIKARESPEAALQRELREELGIRAEIGELFLAYTYRYSSQFQVRLHFFVVRRYRGRMKNRQAGQIRWVELAGIASYDLLGASRRAAHWLANHPSSALNPK